MFSQHQKKYFPFVLVLILGCNGQLRNPCKINQFRCSDGSRCLSTEKLCNGKKDCPQGEDEKGNGQWDCTKTLLSQSCHPQNEFRCRFGGCVPRSAICDGNPDCWGATDESTDTCSGRKPSPPPASGQAPTATNSPRPVASRPVPPTNPPPSSIQRPSSPSAPSSSAGTCPPINDHPVLGFDIQCHNRHGKPLGNCSEASPTGSEATYRCAKYFRLSSLVSSSTKRVCQPNGQWTSRRQNFGCSLECGVGGQSTVGLVTGGVASTEGKWPWHVALYHEDPPNSNKYDLKCGGSLITAQAVLTAAHCATRKFSELALSNSDMRIAMGKFHRSFTKHDKGEQFRGVRHIEVHHEYNQNTLENDIAIIFLNEPALASDHVRPVCLPNEHQGEDVHAGREGNLVGWGRTSGGKFKEQLQEAIIPVVDPHTCKSAHQTFASLVRFSNFCAGYRNGTSACDGDSGGGLVFLDSDTRRHFNIQGIVSAGVAKSTGGGGCEDKYYAVFTKVAKFHTWIETKLDQYYLQF